MKVLRKNVEEYAYNNLKMNIGKREKKSNVTFLPQQSKSQDKILKHIAMQQTKNWVSRI